VSDDRDVIDLEENGHMDHLVRIVISFGLPPIRAIQMASINTARYFGLKNMGAIAPGFRADFILLDDLKSFRISDVFLNGKRIDLNYSGGHGDGINSSSQIGSKVNEMTSDICVNSDDTQLLQSTASSSLSILQNNTMRIKSLDDPNIFSTPAKPTTSSLASIQVIGVIPGQLITQKRVIRPKVNEDHQPLADTYRDIAKIAVIERHHKTGNIGLGFIQGLGLKT